MSDGSPMITAAGMGRLRVTSSIRWPTPVQPTSSSKEKAKCSGLRRANCAASGASARQTAMKAFMSEVPRP
jgi:hypothetical protein